MIPNWIFTLLHIALGLLCVLAIIVVLAAIGFSIAIIVSAIRNTRELP